MRQKFVNEIRALVKRVIFKSENVGFKNYFDVVKGQCFFVSVFLTLLARCDGWYRKTNLQLRRQLYAESLN